jgi:hypothetical protein
MKHRWKKALPACVLGALLLAACGGTSDEDATTNAAAQDGRASALAVGPASNAFNPRGKGGPMIQSGWGQNGDFEILLPAVDGNLRFYKRNNDGNQRWEEAASLCSRWQSEGAAMLFNNASQRIELLSVEAGSVRAWSRGVDGVWKHGRDLADIQATGWPGFVQTTRSAIGDAEMVVPLAAGGMAHYSRNAADQRWTLRSKFGAGAVKGVGMIQSNLPGADGKGTLELVVWVDDRVETWTGSGLGWAQRSVLVGAGVGGNPAIIQSNFGSQGNFEAVVPMAAGGLRTFWLDNDQPGAGWRASSTIPQTGAYRAAGFVQSYQGAQGDFAVCALTDLGFDCFKRNDQRTWSSTAQVPAQEVFIAIGAETPDKPMAGAVGAAVLRVNADDNEVQRSNYKANAFRLTNTGSKKIAAIFIDATGALYGDAVFDADGSGGDTSFKDWNFDSGMAAAGGLDPTTTGAADYREYWLPAHDAKNLDPLFDNVGNGGKGSGGGFRGAALKFSSTLSNGFGPGEVVGFSGDMDPNSIANFAKKTVDGASVPDWDVGGVSGAELIGSTITVLFTDGTLATGQLMGDGSQAGSQALITQAAGSKPAATLTVNGLSGARGGNGSYGAAPKVVVGGPAGATLRVILTKGVQPVQTTEADAKSIVESRLAPKFFNVSNAVEFQTVDITLATGETSRDISGRFNYDNVPNGYAFAGNTRLPLGYVAAVIDSKDKLPLGPVTKPIYLKNTPP